MYTEILVLGLLIFTAHLFTSLFEKTKIPDVLLLMIVGIVCGPLLGLASPDDFGKFGNVMTTIALIVILFDGGSHIGIDTLKTSLKDTLKLSLITYTLSVLAITLMVHFYSQLDWLTSSLTGFILGAVSPAVVLPMINALKFNERPKTILMLETAITDVLTIIIAFNLFEAIRIGSVNSVEIIGKIGISFVMATIIGISGGLAWSALLSKIREFPNTIFTTFAFIFILFGFAEIFHLSGAITCLAFGFTLSNLKKFRLDKFNMLAKINFNELLSSEHSFFQEIMFLLKIFFFVYLGLSFPLENVEILLYSLAISLTLFVIRFLVTKYTIPHDLSIREMVITSIMVPKGLASAVLASVAVQLALPNAELVQTIVYSVILWTILFSAIFVSLLEKTNLKASFARALGYGHKHLLEEEQNSEMIQKMQGKSED